MQTIHTCDSYLYYLGILELSDIEQKRHFYIQSSSWRVPAFFCLLVSALAVVFDHHFYYLHYYLLVVSLIALGISYRKYARLTDSSLKIYTSMFGKKVTINFEQINHISPEMKEVKGFARIGPMGAVPYQFEIDYITINLSKPLEIKLQKAIGSKKTEIIHNKKIETKDNGLNILLYEAPRGGFRPFLDTLSDYVKVLNIERVPYQSKFADLKMAVLYTVLFSGFIILGFIAMYHK